MPDKTLVLVNTTGRQAASVARVASALAYHVRAHVHQHTHPVAVELSQLPNVDIIEGSLEDAEFVDRLFDDADEAFINTVSFGDEAKIGKLLADAGKQKGVSHFIYSSMPDHGVYGHEWPSLPLWSVKYSVECYIRKIGLPASFLYTGVYNNNFTSLPYPLFCMKLQADGSFVWKAPFHSDVPLPWLDAEHDVGPAVVQLLKDGPAKWQGKRIALAFELLTPVQVCQLFSRALNRKCTYEYTPNIAVEVSIPNGYRVQLKGCEKLFGEANAPYFGADLQDPENKGLVAHADPSEAHGESAASIVEQARNLWGGWRGIEEYAREVFPVEEAANGLTWMKEGQSAIDDSLGTAENSMHGSMAKFG